MDNGTLKPEVNLSNPNNNWEVTNSITFAVEPEQLPEGQAMYKEEYYIEEVDGTYSHLTTIDKIGTIGEVVELKTDNNSFWYELINENYRIYYFLFDPWVQESITTGTVEADGSLVLKAYTSRRREFVSFLDHELNHYQMFEVKYGGSFIAPEPPKREGCEFVTWAKVMTTQRQVSNQQNATDCSTGDWQFAYQESEVSTTINNAWDWVVYFPIYAPIQPVEPEPLVPLVPVVPTPNPGRTCQDDGYPEGYDWDGTACIGPKVPNDSKVYVVPNTGLK